MLLDLVFSIDSVITAVGMTDIHPGDGDRHPHRSGRDAHRLASKSIYQFVNRHPSVKMLALAFLLLIGFTLLAEGFGEKIPKGYVYAAMAFSVFVEVLNIGVRRKTSEPVHLHEKMTPDPDSEYAGT